MEKKTSTEILKTMTEDEQRRQELKKIRKERKELKTEMVEDPRSQKRTVEIIEYNDGSFSLKGSAYSLPLQRDEVEEAFISWLNGLLEKGSLFEK